MRKNNFVLAAFPGVSVPLNSFPTSGNFSCLLITFANSLDPDQAQQHVGPDLDPSCLTLMIFLKDFFWKSVFKKNLVDKNSMQRTNPDQMWSNLGFRCDHLACHYVRVINSFAYGHRGQFLCPDPFRALDFKLCTLDTIFSRRLFGIFLFFPENRFDISWNYLWEKQEKYQ